MNDEMNRGAVRPAVGVFSILLDSIATDASAAMEQLRRGEIGENEAFELCMAFKCAFDELNK